ncbi:MAG: polysaccharide biosynthesis C-terminal domain-containing protein [Phycisphaerae bacterium]|jgi:O-antigen/teichoic acid export membrane protein
MSFLRKAILINSSAFICLALGAVQTVVLTRALGPSGIGQYALICNALILGAQLFSLGVPLSLLYYSQHCSENREKYLVNAIWSTLLFGAFGGVTLIVIFVSKQDYFGYIPKFTLVLTGFCVVMILLENVARTTLLIRIEARKLSYINLISISVTIILILSLWALGFMSVPQALLCFIFTEFVKAALGFSWIRNYAKFLTLPSLKISHQLISMGIRQNWSDIVMFANSVLNAFIVKYLLGSFESVGFYTRGQRVAMLVLTAGRSVLPLLFSKWASLSEDRLNLTVEKTMRFTNTVSIIMIAVILLTGKWIILLLYGKEFLPAVTPMLILLPGTVLYLLGRTLMGLLGSRGVPELSALVLLLSAVSNAILCWLLVPLMGIAGAAWAFTISSVILLLVLISIVRKKYSVRVKNCLWVSKNDIKIAMKSLLQKGK